jgi:hypothetical protein
MKDATMPRTNNTHVRRPWGRIGALLVGVSLMTVSAQAQALDRVISADHLGAPVVWAPAAIAQGLWARRVAQGARVAVVFEPAPPRPSDALPTRVDLTGLTVRAALDLLVAMDARYDWREVAGAIVIRPTAAWDDAEHALNLPSVGPASDQPLADAIRQVVGGAAPSEEMAALAAQVDRGQRVTASTGTGQSVLTRLSELAVAGELFIQVRDVRQGPGTFVDVSTWDGQSYAILAPEVQP